MNPWVRQLASINFVVIWLIVVTAFAFLRMVKYRLEN